MTGWTPEGAWQATVDVAPAEVRTRLERGLLVVRSVWFPSLAELRRWERADEPLYLRHDGADLEIGPRLGNLQAVRFCPVLALRVEADGAGSRLTGRLRLPRFTRGLLAVWAGVQAVWLVVGVTLGDVDAGSGWIPWWIVVTLALVGAVALGHVAGGNALRERLPALVRIAQDPGAAEDDW
ncbi:MAG: hypothetical protein H6732_12970 [Alphaproteobacteria bacterium]|nr:hypothetical protein [Alphaproteobacteria bacterium]